MTSLSEHCYFLSKRNCTEFIIEKIIKPDYKILDLGSNIGYYALIFKNKILSNNIILVEPHPQILNYLKNLELNNYNNVEAHLAAISNTDSAKEFIYQICLI